MEKENHWRKTMSEEKKKTPIEGVHFNFDVSDKFPLGPHIHYTTGAASLMDAAYLFKSKKENTDEEKEVLYKINKSSATQDDESKGEGMSEVKDEVVKDLNSKIEKLEKQLAISNAVNSIKDFKLENETEVSKTLAKLSNEDQSVLIGVMKTLVEGKLKAEANAEEAVQKAVEAYKENKEESPLNKMLMKEEGHEDKDSRDEVNKQQVPKTQAEAYKEYLAAKYAKDDKDNK